MPHLPRRVLHASSILAVFASSQAPGAAFAEPSAADRESARTLMKQGDAASTAKDFAAARKAYAEAHRLMNVPSTGRELARAEEALGHLLEAKDVCALVARLSATPGEPAPFEVARKECLDVVKTLDKRLSTLIIEVSGPGAEAAKLALDGAPLVGPSATRRVNPGAHEITLTGAAGAPATQHLTLAEGETKTLALRADGGGPATPKPPGSAEPTPAPPPLPGPLVAPPPVPAKPAPTPQNKTTAYVLLGVGGAALVTGGVFGALTFSAYGKAEDACPTKKDCNQAALDARDSAGTRAWIANGGIGAGLVLGAVGTYLLVRSPSSGAASRYCAPTVGAGSVGGVMGGTF